ncbi:fasciclin-like arabinogalactan protein 12 [Arachis duranensis]|uniref:Fasciclin-like arabinogalactan protein 12 n=1 Tax=Arachis duranensis TaxID=130453 RepID=A0A9C6T8S6_ARADU|nr:fasciclin-like arabinogalactan protein 12 [Arachis duranensis]
MNIINMKQSLLSNPLALVLISSLMCSTTLAALSPVPPPTSAVDILGILTRGGSFNTFIRLMKTTQLINQLTSQLITIKSGGLTIFAPEDAAFSQLKPGFLNMLSNAQKLELVQFHVLPDFVSSSNFDTLTNPVRTLAGAKQGKVELNVISYGGSVNISTGEVNTTINGIIYTDNHLAIYKVAKVLLPSDFFPTKIAAAPAPTLAPAPAVEVAKAPKPDKEKPLDDNSEPSSTQVVPSKTSAATKKREVSVVFMVMLIILTA